MKKLLSFVILILIVSVSFAQLGNNIVTKNGTQTLINKTLILPKINGNVALTPTGTELNTLYGIDTTKTIKEQLDAKPNISDGVNPFTYVYSKAQVDSIIPFTTPVQSNSAILHNGTGSATTIFTGSIPANSITTTGQFDILAIFSFSGTTSKVIQVKFGASAVIQVAPTTQISGAYLQTIANANSLSSQVAWNLGAGLGNSSSVAQTFTIDETQDVPVTVVCNVPVGETATLLFLRVRAIKR